MAAVNIAIGFAPSMRRDMTRCADFIAALRYFSGGAIPEGVNCARTEASRRLAVTAIVAPATGGRVLPGAPQATSAPASGMAPDLSAVPPEWTPPSTSPAPAPVTPTTPAPTTTEPPADDRVAHHRAAAHRAAAHRPGLDHAAGRHDDLDVGSRRRLVLVLDGEQ